jgi:hypothetical protein
VTKKVDFKIIDKTMVLIDSPGFNDTNKERSDEKIFKHITSHILARNFNQQNYGLSAIL